MDILISIKPLLAILISLLVPLVLIAAPKPNLRETGTLTAAVIKFLLIASMIPAVLGGRQIEFTIAQVLPSVAIQFRVDSFGLLFALVSSFLWIVTSVYSIGYMRGLEEHGQTRYYCFFAISLSAAVGVAFSANLLTLYLFYEVLSFATYPLVAHHQDSEAKSAGRRYLFYIVGASIGLVLPAMLIIYSKAGTLDFASHGVLTGTVSPVVGFTLLLLLIFGFAKAAVMPFHAWLPAAMVAPTPVSALLHAVAVVKVGVFSILRVMTGTFGTQFLSTLHAGQIVAFIAAVTIIAASLMALAQDELKRRLAYSTISQLSYIVLGAALLVPESLTGGMLHIAMHAFGKITLFFCAGAIFVATKIKNISQMDGIGRQMPVTMAAFFIGSMCVIGLPPTGGFISKWYLVLGALHSDQLLMLFVLLISSLLNAAYFLPIVYRAFFFESKNFNADSKIQEAPLWCVAPLVLTALASIFLFFYPQPFLALADSAVSRFFTAP